MAKPKPMPGTKITWAEGLTAKKQETNVWCWASAAQMVLSQTMKEKTPSQCEMASKAFDANCCVSHNALPLKCRSGNWPEETLRQNGLAVTKIDGTNFETIRQEILQGRPAIIIAGNGGLHAMVAYGTYLGKNGQDYLIVWDPFTGTTSETKRKRASWDSVILAQ
jgi:hypothetical protein